MNKPHCPESLALDPPLNDMLRMDMVCFICLDGIITTNNVTLSSSSFGAVPPSFTLVGETRGGPPTSYTWTRNGATITTGISISLKNVPERFLESVYVSTLVVTGNLPGVYQYSVTNRAMSNSRDSSFIIEGVWAYNDYTVLLQPTL